MRRLYVLVGGPCGLALMMALGLSVAGCDRHADEPGEAAPISSEQAGQGDGADAEADAEQRARVLAERFREAMEREGRPGALIAEARELVDRHPDHWRARMLLGQMHLAEERYAEAYEQFKRALELEPEDAELHLLTGTVALELDEVDEALERYRRAVAIEPREGRHRMHLAHVYMRQRRYDEARHQLLVALRHDSSMHQAHAAMADLYGQQNEISLALTHIRRALDLLPPDERLDRDERQRKVTYVRRRAMLLRRDFQPADALSVLRDLPAADQFTPGVMEEMARCWAMLGEPENAARHYERALERDPHAAHAAAEAANWHLRAERREDAERMIDRLHRINPRHAQLAELRERLRNDQSQQEQAAD